jgi:hypothetical protein
LDYRGRTVVALLALNEEIEAILVTAGKYFDFVCAFLFVYTAKEYAVRLVNELYRWIPTHYSVVANLS